MTRDAFKRIALQAIEQVTPAAEGRLGRSLPRLFCFGWIGGWTVKREIVADGDVAEFLTEMTFVDEFHIWPCFDLMLERLLPDGRLLLIGYRAGFPPGRYGEHPMFASPCHDAGRVGPFKLDCSHVVEQLAVGQPG